MTTKIQTETRIPSQDSVMTITVGQTVKNPQSLNPNHKQPNRNPSTKMITLHSVPLNKPPELERQEPDQTLNSVPVRPKISIQASGTSQYDPMHTL